MAKASPWYVGQEFEDPTDPTAPVLVWSGKNGLMEKEQYLAQRGQGQEAFDNQLALMRQIDRAKSKITPGSTGFMGKLTADDGAGAYRGIGGTPGYSLDKALLPIRSNSLIRTVMEMRKNSPTGAAMGNPTEGEGKKLESLDAALDVGMTADDLTENLDTIAGAVSRRQPGLTRANPYRLGSHDPSDIPEGALWTDRQGRVFTQRKGAGYPSTQGPSTKVQAPQPSPTANRNVRAAQRARGGSQAAGGWSIKPLD